MAKVIKEMSIIIEMGIIIIWQDVLEFFYQWHVGYLSRYCPNHGLASSSSCFNFLDTRQAMDVLI